MQIPLLKVDLKPYIDELKALPVFWREDIEALSHLIYGPSRVPVSIAAIAMMSILLPSRTQLMFAL